VAIGSGVNRQNKSREVNQHACLKSPKESAPQLLEMCVETVEGHGKAGDMEDISDKNPLAVKGEYGGAATKDGNKGVIAHSDLQICNGLVRNED
jgi:hypothetical protein